MTDDQTPVDQKQSGALRKGTLYGLLVIMLIALGYDYLVARPAVDQAYDKIAAESQRINGIGHQVFSNADVSKLLGKEPTESRRDGQDLVEVYAFAGGLPFRPHRLFAVYKKQGETEAFYRHAKFAYETSAEVAPIPVRKVTKLTKEGYAEAAAQIREEARSRRFNYEAMFDERDADDDKKLTGNEMPPGMQDELSTIDKDGDDSVSKEEMMQRLEELGVVAAAGPAAGEQAEIEPTSVDQEQANGETQSPSSEE